MLGTRLTSEDIAAHIREAGETCLLIAPGADAIVTEALIERAKHAATKACVVIDGSHHAERSGYGKTGTWRALMKATELRVMPGTRPGSAWCRASTQPAASRGGARYRRWASAPPLTPEPGRAARRCLPAR